MLDECSKSKICQYGLLLWGSLVALLARNDSAPGFYAVLPNNEPSQILLFLLFQREVC